MQQEKNTPTEAAGQEVTYALKPVRTFDSSGNFPEHTCIGWEPAVMKYVNGKEVGIVGGLLPGTANLPDSPEDALKAAIGKETTFIDRTVGYRFKGDGTYHKAHVQVQTRFVPSVYPAAVEEAIGLEGGVQEPTP